jgi:long-chain acyl-CoA synthetase
MTGATTGEEDATVNLAERLAACADRQPDAVAVRFQGDELSYGRLAERVARAAGALLALGLAPAGVATPGDRVALLIGNTPDYIEAFHAIAHAGLVVVPLNTGFTPDEVAHILGDSGARAIVVAEALVPVLDGLRQVLPDLAHVLVVGGAGARSWRASVDAADPAGIAQVADDALAILQYTSGTTGRPKGAMLTHGNLLANQEQMAGTRLGVTADDVVLCVLPLFHIYALNVAMAFPLAQGATILLIERFDPLSTLHDIVDGGVTVIIGAPPMYVAWVNTPGSAELDLSHVRYAVSGAAALPAPVLARFTEELGVPLWEGYGLTETSPLLTTAAMGESPRPGSVGKPVPGVEIRLVGERGEPVRRGDPGEVVVRGPNVFAGYWGQPEATAAVLDGEGWFRTGDVGYAEEGNLYLVDRKTDLIIVSGFNVYPREVEEVLFRHPKVIEAAVIGVPHPYTGESVKAVLVLGEGEQATAQEISDFCARSLARFKCPEVVEFVPALPHLPSGKVLRRELRDPSGS